MRNYLVAMSQVQLPNPPELEKPKTLIAALGPKMMALAGEKSDGAHPYLVTPEHTARAREILGPDKWLCPEQKVLLETDPTKARAMISAQLANYLQLPNYLKNLMRIGFTSEDFSNGGSKRLLDAIVAWGDEAAIRRRIQEHWDAGADHVCIQTITSETFPPAVADERLLAILAPGTG